MDHGLIHKDAIYVSLLEYIIACSLAEYWVHGEFVFLYFFGRFLFFLDQRPNIAEQRVLISLPLIHFILFYQLSQLIKLNILELEGVNFSDNFEPISDFSLQYLAELLLLGFQKPIIKRYLLVKHQVFMWLQNLVEDQFYGCHPLDEAMERYFISYPQHFVLQKSFAHNFMPYNL